MARPPAFMFYAADFKTNTAELTHEERGVYIDLLCHAWINDGLPVDQSRLNRLIGGANPSELWASIEHLWERTDVEHPFGVRWVNPRMEEERDKQARRRAQKSLAGQKSAKSRKERTKSNTRTNGRSNTRSISVDDPLQRGANLSIESEKETENVVELSVERNAREPLDEILFALREVWPKARNFPSDHNRQAEAIFDQRDHLPDEPAETARLYLSAHGFTDESCEGCPNLSKWIADRRWEAPLPARKETATQRLRRELAEEGAA